MDRQGNRYYYHKIPGLVIPKMSNYKQVHSDINKFIDTIPNLTKILEGNYTKISTQRDQFLINMELMLLLLQNVHARSLTAEAEQILSWYKEDDKFPLALKRMKQFITDILSLSVAMQKAQIFDKEKKDEAVSEIETRTDMAKNLSTVFDLFDEGKYEKARKMILDLAEHDPAERAFVKLLELINANKYYEAKSTLNNLKEKYIEVINKLMGTDLSKKIMAVDDMPEILSFVNYTLKAHYKVFAAASGKAALKILETHKPDLFILDIDMPEMDGYELARIIRKTPGHEKTPIIFLTGNSTREHILKAIATGCNDFIVKPTTYECLRTKVSKFFNV
jgi:CheY-like chemotaxis protein